jgi:hypothetical protein
MLVYSFDRDLPSGKNPISPFKDLELGVLLRFQGTESSPSSITQRFQESAAADALASSHKESQPHLLRSAW